MPEREDSSERVYQGPSTFWLDVSTGAMWIGIAALSWHLAPTLIHKVVFAGTLGLYALLKFGKHAVPAVRRGICHVR